MPVTDFLDVKRREITDQMKKLKPMVEEHRRLEAAAKALDGIPASPNGAPAPAPRPTRGRRGPGRPRGSKTKTTAAPGPKRRRRQPRRRPPPHPESQRPPSPPQNANGGGVKELAIARGRR